AGSQTVDVTILNVTAIAAEVNGDTVDAGSFADAGDGDRIRLGVFRVGHCRIPHLAQGSDVINVYPKPKTLNWHSIGSRRRALGQVISLLPQDATFLYDHPD